MTEPLPLTKEGLATLKEGDRVLLTIYGRVRLFRVRAARQGVAEGQTIERGPRQSNTYHGLVRSIAIGQEGKHTLWITFSHQSARLGKAVSAFTSDITPNSTGRASVIIKKLAHRE